MRSPAQPDPADVPREHALLVIDMKGYSRIPEARMAPARFDLDSILDTVSDQSGLEMPRRVDGAFDDNGDGAIFVPPARDTTRLVDPLLGNLNAALCRYDKKSRLHSAPEIRLRASAHVGPVSLPDRRNRAVVEACRLVDSEAVREALDAAEAHGAYLAVAVSEIAFRRTVRDGRTLDLDERHFLRATARVNGKPEFEEPCRLLVPGVSPVLLGPSITDVAGPRPSSAPAPAPARGAANSSSPEAGHRGSVLNAYRQPAAPAVPEGRTQRGAFLLEGPDDLGVYEKAQLADPRGGRRCRAGGMGLSGRQAGQAAASLQRKHTLRNEAPQPAGSAQETGSDGARPLARSLGSVLAVFVTLYALHVGIEAGVGGWEPTHLETVGYGAGAAATAISVYWLMMTVGRFLVAPLALRFSARAIITVFCAGMTACLLLAAVPALAPCAYAGVGLFIAPIFPTGLPWLNKAAPRARRAGALVIAMSMAGGVVAVPARVWEAGRGVTP